MQVAFKDFSRLLNRRSRNGQSILIVAFAFIALIAFVGIAVDVALLFVRYSALARAVDAAAIAAAGQVREGTQFPTLQAAAEQFILLQGNIEANTVRVETCETEIFEVVTRWRRDGGYSDTTLYKFNETDYATGKKDALYDILRVIDPVTEPSELCKRDPQKLVRVSAKVDSQTTFLGLLGFPLVTLTYSSVSQTAVLDVALVIDTSLSMTYDTYNVQATYADGPDADTDNGNELKAFNEFMTPLGLAPYDTDVVNGVDMSSGLPAIRYECWNTTAPSSRYRSNYAYGGCCNDPTTQTLKNNSQIDSYNDLDWFVYDNNDLPEAEIQHTGTNSHTGTASARVTSGNPDNNYSDLICQPFKQVRDAARRFIKRLDFVRGDRLFLVTINRDAKIISPVNPADPGNPLSDQTNIPVITDKALAIQTLNRRVGASLNLNGRQAGCVTFEQALPENGLLNWRKVYSYWTTSQCTDTNTGGGILAARAAITNPDYIRRDAVWVMVMLSDGFPNRTPSYVSLINDGDGKPDQLTHNWLSVPYIATNPPTPCGDGTSRPCNLADLEKYCRQSWEEPLSGTMPEFCTRANGWGPADWGEVEADSTFKPSFGFCPWYTFCNQNGNNQAQTKANKPPDNGGVTSAYVRAECSQLRIGATDSKPPWWDSDPSNRDSGGNLLPWQGEPGYPFCLDWNPDTRHFCTGPTGDLLLDPTVAGCDQKYDPDDYARDQADQAGLLEYSPSQKGDFIAMFTIFFAHKDAAAATVGAVNANILGVKFLRYMADAGDNGYIDNHLQAWYRTTGRTVSADTVKDLAADPNGNVFLPSGSPQYGAFATQPTDPCSGFDYRDVLDTSGTSRAAGVPPVQPPSGVYENLATADCGQFWYADNIKKVNAAFAEIASRLFTRLSR